MNKELLLAEYDIRFHHWSLALILSKAVLILEHVALPGKLLSYSFLTVLRRYPGRGGSRRVFLDPVSAPRSLCE